VRPAPRPLFLQPRTQAGPAARRTRPPARAEAAGHRRCPRTLSISFPDAAFDPFGPAVFLFSDVAQRDMRLDNWTEHARIPEIGDDPVPRGFDKPADLKLLDKERRPPLFSPLS